MLDSTEYELLTSLAQLSFGYSKTIPSATLLARACPYNLSKIAKEKSITVPRPLLVMVFPSITTPTPSATWPVSFPIEAG